MSYVVPQGDDIVASFQGASAYAVPQGDSLVASFKPVMNFATLNFKKTYTPPASNDVRLNFGFEASENVDPRTLGVDIPVAAMQMTVDALYESNVSRPLTNDMDFGWQQADFKEVQPDAAWQLTAQDRTYKGVPWQSCNQLHDTSAVSFGEMDHDRQFHGMPWEEADPTVRREAQEIFKELSRDRQFKKAPWQLGSWMERDADGLFEQMLSIKQFRRMPWQDTKYLSWRESFGYNKAKAWPLWWLMPWNEGRHLRPGREVSPQPPVTPPFIPSHTLNFICKYKPVPPLEVMLNFGLHPCPEKGLEIVARKVYFIVNTISLKRVSDNEPIEILGASVGIDKSSWAWSFSGSLPYTELEKVEPSASGPVEVELEINSIKWRFLVEEYDENKQFAKTAISIRGRSLTAYLDSPYAPTRSFIQNNQLTSRQFAEAELTRPGLITGFDFDWMFPDELGWDMPAGTWSYNNLTPLEVINQIVQGAGGYVNSHRLNKTLIVRPEYPVPFWEWGLETPDLVLPKTLIRSQNLRWAEKPLYNGVYVTGENTGVTALVRKSGTIGDFQAPSFTGAMISSNLAARLKGISILSAGGKQATVGLELPMEQSVGLLTPGMLIEVTNGGYGTEAAWRGLIRSTSIEARRTNQSLTVSQSVDLERHYGGF